MGLYKGQKTSSCLKVKPGTITVALLKPRPIQVASKCRSRTQVQNKLLQLTASYNDNSWAKIRQRKTLWSQISSEKHVSGRKTCGGRIFFFSPFSSQRSSFLPHFLNPETLINSHDKISRRFI